MSIADKYRPQFTFEDYLLWEGRWELIEGMPYAMSPALSPDHQKINGRFWSAFSGTLQKNCDTCEVYLPIDWKINDRTVVQPDLLIVCKKIEKKYLDFTPSLTVEILSSSTAYKDRHEKFELYEQEGVKYYLIVDPAFQKTEIYELIEGKYLSAAVSPADFEFILKEDCRFSIKLDNIWD
jgi:Uma2 family endonuclease